MKRMLLIVSVLCAMTATAGRTTTATNTVARFFVLTNLKIKNFNDRRLAQNQHKKVIKAFETVQEASEYGITRKAIIDKYAAQLKKILELARSEEAALRNTHFKAHEDATAATLNAALIKIEKEYKTAKATLKARYPKTVTVVPVDESVTTNLDAEATAV
jgi:hypothetical protein